MNNDFWQECMRQTGGTCDIVGVLRSWNDGETNPAKHHGRLVVVSINGTKVPETAAYLWAPAVRFQDVGQTYQEMSKMIQDFLLEKKIIFVQTSGFTPPKYEAGDSSFRAFCIGWQSTFWCSQPSPSLPLSNNPHDPQNFVICNVPARPSNGGNNLSYSHAVEDGASDADAATSGEEEVIRASLEDRISQLQNQVKRLEFELEEKGKELGRMLSTNDAQKDTKEHILGVNEKLGNENELLKKEIDMLKQHLSKELENNRIKDQEMAALRTQMEDVKEKAKIQIATEVSTPASVKDASVKDASVKDASVKDFNKEDIKLQCELFKELKELLNCPNHQPFNYAADVLGLNVPKYNGLAEMQKAHASILQQIASNM